MLLRQIARNAARSESARERIRTEGRTCNGDPIWTKREDEKIRRLYPDYRALKIALRRRTRMAIVCRASKLRISKKRQLWTAADISRLRRIYPTGTDAEIATAFPAFTKRQVQAIANRLRIPKKRRRYKRTGIAIIDAIRDRAFDLNLTMKDLDALANSRHYFQNCCRELSSVNGLNVYRAIEALDGQVTATWR